MKISKLTVFEGRSDNPSGVERVSTAFFNCAGVRILGTGAINSGSGKNALIQGGRTAWTIV